MEYLDGATLAQRLEQGALPLDQALQIADARPPEESGAPGDKGAGLC